MMEYRAIKDALDALLEENANANYEVITAKKRSRESKNVLALPEVTTYYKSGNFPKSGGSYSGPFLHSMTFAIDILVGAQASMDLSVLDQEGVTAAHIASALSASTDAANAADEKFDEVASRLWAIIMDPANSSLGLEYEPSRWITQIQKNDALKKGAIVLVSGSLTMTAEAPEDTEGAAATAGSIVDSTIHLTTDSRGETLDNAKQGVEVGNE
jgi:hypothetical protein